MFLNDQETATDEAIAKTVVNLIRKSLEAPVTIGVHGDWGAGKSSILKMTEAAFGGDERVPTARTCSPRAATTRDRSVVSLDVR